jgi:hypothetical protein
LVATDEMNSQFKKCCEQRKFSKIRGILINSMDSMCSNTESDSIESEESQQHERKQNELIISIDSEISTKSFTLKAGL